MRLWLDLERRLRDPSMFALAIDSKLRGCDVVKVKIGDLVSGGRIRSRAIVMQQKTARPVQFELLEPARISILAWLERRGGTLDEFVFPSRIDHADHISTRQYARLVEERVTGIRLRPETGIQTGPLPHYRKTSRGRECVIQYAAKQTTADIMNQIQPSLPDSVETVIVPRAHDVGGFEVHRALPAKQKQMIGPFIFFDQMGPGEFLTGMGLDVRPHPHIGLATVTYLFDGSIMHRDSLGTQLPIVPGDVNWMTAGSGIAHSERTDTSLRSHRNPLFGIQSWVALPKSMEETPAAFAHHEAVALPVLEDGGVVLRLIAGEGWGSRSPVSTHWPLVYADATLAPGAKLPMPDQHEERGVYVVSGSVDIAGTRFEAGRMLLLRPGDPITLTAGPLGARFLLLGGAVMDGPRYIFWNFVSSSRDRIEQAKADWKAGRFGTVAGDEREFIPLPEVAATG